MLINTIFVYVFGIFKKIKFIMISQKLNIVPKNLLTVMPASGFIEVNCFLPLILLPTMYQYSTAVSQQW